MSEPAPARRILVTGASGFVGRAAVLRLASDGHAVRACSRSPDLHWPAGVVSVASPDLAPSTRWDEALDGVEVVVHCAARAHVLRETESEPLAAFRRANVDGTMALARQAADRGVRRFVFLSSVGVHGAVSRHRPFTALDTPAPHSPYARSKLEAEIALGALARDTDMELVVIRPPLVIGPGAPGNFERLLRSLRRGFPLPLGAINNRRSFVSLDNLTDLMALSVVHPAAVGEPLLVSDDEDVSTTDFLRRVAAALGVKVLLIPFPAAILSGAARVLGRKELAQRLFESLQVDISRTRERLGWTPPMRLNDALRSAADAYLTQERSR